VLDSSLNFPGAEIGVQSAVYEVVYRHLPEDKANVASTLWDTLYYSEALKGLTSFLADIAQLVQIDSDTMQALRLELYGSIHRTARSYGA